MFICNSFEIKYVMQAVMVYHTEWYSTITKIWMPEDACCIILQNIRIDQYVHTASQPRTMASSPQEPEIPSVFLLLLWYPVIFWSHDTCQWIVSWAIAMHLTSSHTILILFCCLCIGPSVVSSSEVFFQILNEKNFEAAEVTPFSFILICFRSQVLWFSVLEQ